MIECDQHNLIVVNSKFTLQSYSDDGHNDELLYDLKSHNQMKMRKTNFPIANTLPYLFFCDDSECTGLCFDSFLDKVALTASTAQEQRIVEQK